MADEITIPGTETKIPQWALLAVVAVVVVWLILRNKGDGQVDTSGVLAEEYNQRLQDLYNQTQAALQEQQQGTTVETPLRPPGSPTGAPPPAQWYGGNPPGAYVPPGSTPPPITTPPNPPEQPAPRPGGTRPPLGNIQPPPTYAGVLSGTTVAGITTTDGAMEAHRKAVLQHEKLMAGQTVPKVRSTPKITTVQQQHRAAVLQHEKLTTRKPAKPSAAAKKPASYPKVRAI